MELPSKILEQIAYNTRPTIEEHMLSILNKSTHEEHLSQPLQTNKKQFKITGYNGDFNDTISNFKFSSKKTITKENDFIQITIPPGAYEIESTKSEIRRIIIAKGHYSESEYPFMM